MPRTKQELKEIGRVFAEVWAEATDVDRLRTIYHPDAVLVSPFLSSPVEGRDAVMACFQQVFEDLPEGKRYEILALLPGVEMLNICWRLGDGFGADTLLIGDDGTITRHYDTGAHRPNSDGSW